MDTIHERTNFSKTMEKTPQRPQDLINSSSLGIASVNIRSSAQYRKSYAFKIWKEKGCFPYRLADQPSMQERKISKKYLNALKAQRDRRNEIAWRAFKNFKANHHKNAQTPTQRVGKEKNNGMGIEKQLKRAIPMTASQGGLTTTKNMAHQNSISDYFKTKKDVLQKGPTSTATLLYKSSIPTSVIHINNTKTRETCQSVTQYQAEQSNTAKEEAEIGVKKGFNNNAKQDMTITSTTGTARSIDLKRDVLSLYETSTQAATCRRATISTFQRPQQVPGRLAAAEQNHTVASTVYSLDEGYNKVVASSSHTISTVQNPQAQYSTEPTAIRPTYSANVVSISSRSTDQQKESSKLMEDDAGSLGTRLEYAAEVTEKCKTLPERTMERDANHSSLDSASMVEIIKLSLNKKYCKENVIPDSGSTVHSRKRRRVSTRENGETQLAVREKTGSTAKASMFTRLDETVATNLADGIHNVNSEYFPIDALAKKAAKETSEHIKSTKNKVDEITRARLLLKELFEVTSESGEDREMKTFDVASRSFGRKNILNHLSLLDRYFAEYQKKLCNESASKAELS